MTNLYTELARVYHEMYQVLFDYKVEFTRYHHLLQKNGPCHSVLEVACGSGNLAVYFRDTGYDYYGLDSSGELLEIAREINPQTTFIQADMRSFSVEKPFDALIVTGRSFGYLITNQDVLHTLGCFHKSLSSTGILIFDSFDAESVIQKEYTAFTQEVECNGRKIVRINNRQLNLDTGFTWNWEAQYIIEDPISGNRIVEDHTILRAFTVSELTLLLKISGFSVIDVDKENQLLFSCRKEG